MEDIPCVYRISVKAIIKDDQERILLIRQRRDLWELPGGGLEHGEDPQEGMTREIKEEIGHQLDWMSQTPTAFWTIQSKLNARWYAFVAYASKVSGDFVASDEASELKYFSPEEVRKLPLHENTKPYFEQLWLPSAAN